MKQSRAVEKLKCGPFPRRRLDLHPLLPRIFLRLHRSSHMQPPDPDRRLVRASRLASPETGPGLPARPWAVIRSSSFIQTAKLAESFVEKAGFEPRTLGTGAECVANCAILPVLGQYYALNWSARTAVELSQCPCICPEYLSQSHHYMQMDTPCPSQFLSRLDQYPLFMTRSQR
jgi:hypothetical protein